jgi:hypothetical protein
LVRTGGRLEPPAITGGRLGGVARAAVDPLPEAGQLGRKSGELGAEQLNLLLLLLALMDKLKKSSPHANWCSGPVRF